MSTLKTYLCDESCLFAAESVEQAAQLYQAHVGEDLEDGYPRELGDDELDRPQPEFDEDERPTGEWTSVRAFLDEATEPGWLAESVW